MPTISVSASIVIWLRVKSSAAMTPKAPMIDAGMATAAISVERKLRRKMKTMIAARMPPRIEVLFDRGERGADELRVVADQPDLEGRRQRLRDFRHARPDRVGERDRVDAALLADRDRDRRLAVERSTPTCGSAPVSSTVPMSRMRIGMLPRVATTMSANSSGVRQPADRAHRQLARALLEPAARQLEVLRAQRRGDVGGRERVGVQPIGIDLDLDLRGAGRRTGSPRRRR